MEKKVTFVKDAHLHIRVDKADLKKWKQRASQWDIPLTVFAIRALNFMDGFAVPPIAKNVKRDIVMAK